MYLFLVLSIYFFSLLSMILYHSNCPRFTQDAICSGGRLSSPVTAVSKCFDKVERKPSKTIGKVHDSRPLTHSNN